MDPQIYRYLLRDKLQALIDADPEAAKRAMQMSVDAAPEFYQIAQSSPSNEWASQIIQSDGMNHLFSGLSMEGQLIDPPSPPQSLLEILEVLP